METLPMNDHSLDDLIIHDIPPMQNAKSNSFLTIIALLIVVLIVGIFLMQALFGTSDTEDIAIDESASYRSSDLKLQTPEENKTKPEAPVTKKPEVIKEETISPSATNTQKAKKPEANTATPTKVPEDKKPAAAKPVVEKPVAKEPVAEKPAEKKPIVEKEVQKSAEAKKPVVEKPVAKKPVVEKPVAKKEVQKSAEAKKPASATANAEQYFVQVGSFTKDPSERFLSVIKNSGFQYKITNGSKNGIKKLLIGPYNGRSAVDEALVRVRDRISKSAFVTQK